MKRVPVSDMGLNRRDSTACFYIRNNNDARERERERWSATRPSTISHKRGARLEAGCEMHNIVKFHYRCNNAALIRLRKTTGPSLLSYSRVAVRCFRSAFNGTLGRPGGPLVHVWSGSKKGPRSTVYMRVWEGPPFRYDLFSVFVLFDRAHSRRRLREGGSREEEERIEDSFNFEKPISISIWTRNFWRYRRSWNRNNGLTYRKIKYILEIPRVPGYLWVR